MGSEAISRGPRGGMPVRSNRREMRSEEDIGEEMLCTVEDQSFLLCVVLCCEFLIALFCPSHPPCMTKLRRREATTACRPGPESFEVLSSPPPLPTSFPSSLIPGTWRTV